MNILNWVPNILTSVRILLTIIYLSILYNLHSFSDNTIYFIFGMVVYILICLTDFMDGKIARKLKVVSAIGELLDVVADFIFIVSSHIVLVYMNMIPRWFIVLILAKFIEFILTSRIIHNHKNRSNALFLFDYLGRIAAVNFFIIPGMILLVHIGLNIMFINIFLYLTLILVLISSFNRCINCYKALQARKKQILMN